jgi:D-glycero-beta-D-manno-heptose 1-phosphate adenylyltransferase
MNKNQDREYFVLLPDKNDVSILAIVGNKPSEKDRIITDREKLKWIIGVLKKEGLKIVYTSGVYDMIHDGHLEYLAKARELGDILVVGVDDDEYTRARKPDEKNRPIDTLFVRQKVLAHNRSVNIIVPRTLSEHPDQLIKDILPDIAVFSYSTEKDRNLFEERIRNAISSYVGELVFLEPQSTNSTTAKIRRVAGNGSHELSLFIKKRVEDQSVVSIEMLDEIINDFFTFKEQGG